MNIPLKPHKPHISHISYLVDAAVQVVHPALAPALPLLELAFVRPSVGPHEEAPPADAIVLPAALVPIAVLEVPVVMVGMVGGVGVGGIVGLGWSLVLFGFDYYEW